MAYALGFDVYDTLVDPQGMQRHLRPLVGDLADRFATLWRTKQLEYAFRRGVMGKYENFSLCRRQALVYTMQTLKVALSSQHQEQLMADYQDLPVFVDVIHGLRALKIQGHKLVAFSNGTELIVRNMLSRAGLLSYFDIVISTDDIRAFKPSPAVYIYLARTLNRPLHETWLVSSNTWDVIGAKAAGLKAVWVKRNIDTVFDPWGIEPDLIIKDLSELSSRMV